MAPMTLSPLLQLLLLSRVSFGPAASIGRGAGPGLPGRNPIASAGARRNRRPTKVEIDQALGWGPVWRKADAQCVLLPARGRHGLQDAATRGSWLLDVLDFRCRRA